jgi:hypothetical protein
VYPPSRSAWFSVAAKRSIDLFIAADLIAASNTASELGQIDRRVISMRFCIRSSIILLTMELRSFTPFSPGLRSPG